MTDRQIQYSFNSGEWAPALNARVDLTKYRNAAALLLNYFVDYRGGASTRPGTKYILQAFDSTNPVRLITMQLTLDLGYVLEFGENYIRFYNSGAPVLESALAITGATQANPAVVTVANSYVAGDVVYITGVSGMTQLNGRYFKLSAAGAGNITLADLNGVAVNSTTYGTWTAGGTVQRVYKLPSPYAAADLALLKFAQNVDQLILVHPDYAPQVLTFVSATNWNIAPVAFGTTAGTPTNAAAATTLAAGNVNYSYVVTSVDAGGQESAASTAATLASKQDLRTVAGSNRITWTAVSGAMSYNVYKAVLVYNNAVPTGAAHGFIGNCTDVTFDDTNIDADYSQTPPIAYNPFRTGSVASVTVTNTGTGYASVPTVTLGAPPSGVTATAAAILESQTHVIVAGGVNYVVGDFITLSNGIIIQVTGTGGGGIVNATSVTAPGTNRGSISSGSVPTNPLAQSSTSGVGSGFTMNVQWRVASVNVINGGSGYVTAPAVSFSGGGGAAATAVLGSFNGNNPSAISFFQQRLVLAAQETAPQTFYMSQPGAYFNFNTFNPTQADGSITGTLVSGQLNEIQSMVSMPSGLIILSNKAAWQVDGGANGAPVTPIDTVANAHSYNGVSSVPPIVANFDILYVQAKGSIVRDLVYNFNTNIFTGTDISVLSSHLFYGYEVLEWAWAEEPFKLVWAVRDDGTILTLTFLREQEFIGWTHSTTGASGKFKSVASVTESTADAGTVDAVYFVVERTINGNVVKYIERLAERIFPNGVEDAWCVDAGLQYNGAPATTFTGGEHLAGATVTGLADGLVITPFAMPPNGSFTLATAASKVTVGLGYNCDLQTLALDMGEPTVQGKDKKIVDVVVRVADTLGLSIGSTFSNLVAMKDLVVGNVGGMTNAVVSDLVTGDAKTILDPKYQVPGQYCIRQSNPFPASILGVIPTIALGDTPSARKDR